MRILQFVCPRHYFTKHMEPRSTKL